MYGLPFADVYSFHFDVQEEWEVVSEWIVYFNNFGYGLQLSYFWSHAMGDSCILYDCFGKLFLILHHFYKIVSILNATLGKPKSLFLYMHYVTALTFSFIRTSNKCSIDSKLARILSEIDSSLDTLNFYHIFCQYTLNWIR